MSLVYIYSMYTIPGTMYSIQYLLFQAGGWVGVGTFNGSRSPFCMVEVKRENKIMCLKAEKSGTDEAAC
jgi:hypothetical protein